MLRRDFLKVTGAFASIELERPERVERENDQVSTDEHVTSLARTLPAAAELAYAPHYALSVTRLTDESVSVSEPAFEDATAYGTVFAGRTTLDVAVGFENADAFRDRLRASGFEATGDAGGATLFHDRTNHKHRVVAVHDSTAVVGAGPVRDAVGNAVETTVAVTRTADQWRVVDGDRRTVIDHLGPGTHLSVDTTPDSNGWTDAVVATGERFETHGGTTSVRSVALFDTVRDARTADVDGSDAGTQLAERVETAPSVDYRGRTLVRDATIPTERFLARP